MPPLSQLCDCIELDVELINFNVFVNNIVYHNFNKNKVEEEIKVPEIKVVFSVNTRAQPIYFDHVLLIEAENRQRSNNLASRLDQAKQ
jgi:hypothetical protein